MSQTINTREIETRIRQRIHDLGSRVFDSGELLATLDDELRVLFSEMRSAGQSYGQDYLDVTIASMTQIESGVYEYRPPDYVSDIQLIEALVSLGQPSLPIPFVPNELKDVQRTRMGGTGVVWTWGRNGAVQIRGSISPVTVRLWFIRALGPMVYGTSSAGSTTSLTIATVTGAHKNRTDIYRGLELEVTSDGSAANVGQVVRVSAYGSSVLTFDALPAAASSSTAWAMVVPVPPEYVELVIARTAVSLLSRTGNAEEYQLQLDKLQRAEKAFAQNVTNRQTGEPRRLYNSRLVR